MKNTDIKIYIYSSGSGLENLTSFIDYKVAMN
jgi:hypothetical protein